MTKERVSKSNIKKDEELRKLIQMYRECDKSVLKNVLFDKINKNTYYLTESVINIFFTQLNDLSNDLTKDEIVHIANIALHKSIEGFNIDSDVMFTTYYYKALKNDLLQELKKLYKHKKDKTNQCMATYSLFNKSCEIDEVKVETSLISDLLKECFDKLQFNSERVKNVYKEYTRLFSEDKTEKSTRCLAKQFDISQQAVSKIIVRYNRELKKIIEESLTDNQIKDILGTF